MKIWSEKISYNVLKINNENFDTRQLWENIIHSLVKSHAHK